MRPCFGRWKNRRGYSLHATIAYLCACRHEYVATYMCERYIFIYIYMSVCVGLVFCTFDVCAGPWRVNYIHPWTDACMHRVHAKSYSQKQTRKQQSTKEAKQARGQKERVLHFCVDYAVNMAVWHTYTVLRVYSQYQVPLFHKQKQRNCVMVWKICTQIKTYAQLLYTRCLMFCIYIYIYIYIHTYIHTYIPICRTRRTYSSYTHVHNM
jgi:hypothetical protein